MNAVMNCHICQKPLSGRYYIDSWDHKVCESCHDNVAVVCSSCSGYTKKDLVLPDGRVLCGVCTGLAVKTGDSIDTAKRAVVNALSKVGFDDLRTEDITVEVVSAQKLADLRKSPVDLQNKGLALSQKTTSFGILQGKKQNFKHNIYVLTHLSKIEFAGVLAHEMLHAWQVQNNVSMTPKLTEGLCNLGSFLMYNTLASSLTTIYLKTLHESPDPIYGDGFREIYALYEEWGWSELIKNVRENKIY